MRENEERSREIKRECWDLDPPPPHFGSLNIDVQEWLGCDNVKYSKNVYQWSRHYRLIKVTHHSTYILINND